ncbi:hypothetical protein HDR61_02750 [bacterium]|nr:hypothetical protein [bacterium]
MKKTVIFCTGLSGSGKSYFIQNMLPTGHFHKLISATTRPMRPGEVDGREYYFRDETYFDTEPLATRLWVNQAQWTPGKPKWLYGVPEFEIRNHMDTNIVYDVIQPKYAAQMRNWFINMGLGDEYLFKVLYFIAPENNFDIAQNRANMPDDTTVRKANTCTPLDFLRAGLDIDFLVKCSADETIISPRLQAFLTKIGRRR